MTHLDISEKGKFGLYFYETADLRFKGFAGLFQGASPFETCTQEMSYLVVL